MAIRLTKELAYRGRDMSLSDGLRLYHEYSALAFRSEDAREGTVAFAELRELVRYRHKLRQLQAGLKAQVHAVLGKQGLIQPVGLWGQGGARWLDGTQMAPAFEQRLESLRDLIEVYDTQIDALDATIARRVANDDGYRAIQAIHGVGPVTGAVFVAEIGEIDRFANRAGCAAGRGWFPATGNRTPKWCAVGSPNKVPSWCAGQPSRPSPRTTADHTSKPSTGKSPSGAASTKHALLPLARSSPWCSGGYETATSAVSTTPTLREGRARSAQRARYRHDPPTGAAKSRGLHLGSVEHQFECRRGDSNPKYTRNLERRTGRRVARNASSRRHGAIPLGGEPRKGAVS